MADSITPVFDTITLGLTGSLILNAAVSQTTYDANAAAQQAAAAAQAQQAAAAAAQQSSTSGGSTHYISRGFCSTIQFGNDMATQQLTNGQILTLECELQSKNSTTYSIKSLRTYDPNSSEYDGKLIHFTTFTPNNNLYATPDGYPVVFQGAVSNVTLDNSGNCYGAFFISYQADAQFDIKVIRMGLSDPA